MQTFKTKNNYCTNQPQLSQIKMATNDSFSEKNVINEINKQTNQKKAKCNTDIKILMIKYNHYQIVE